MNHESWKMVLEKILSSNTPEMGSTSVNGFVSTWARLKRTPPLFLAVVILPTLLSVLYYWLIASDIYVSEARFVVRNPSRSSGSSSALAQMMGASSYSSASADSYPVIDYIQSRDASAELDYRGYMRNIYSQQGDWISKYHAGLDDNTETLWRYYKRHVVDIDVDDETSIITMKTMAYQAQQSQDINIKLLAMGERLVNRMNERAMHDAIDSAQVQVDIAEKRTKDAAVRLAEYRSGSGVYNPDQQSVVQLQQTAQLQARLFSAESQLDQLKRVAPDNPQVDTINANILALKGQLAASNAEISGGSNSLSKKGPQYTAAALDLQFASQQLGMALTTLESARANALHKQLYLEEIVRPNLPVEAIEPRRIRNIITVLLASLLAWMVTKMFIESVREHKD